jgi:ABC-type uncharacterized transport system substrate-binding protein
MELLKEVVPKLAHVAVFYEPGAPDTVVEVKEPLPVASRALGLTLLPWEVRAADDFDRVLAALREERPDGLCTGSFCRFTDCSTEIVFHVNL